MRHGCSRINVSPPALLAIVLQPRTKFTSGRRSPEIKKWSLYTMPQHGGRSPKRTELAKLVSFGCVGLISFLVYLLMMTVVVETGGSPVLGAAAGFVGGTIVSFYGACLFVFKMAPSAYAGRRFVITTAIGFGLNIALAAAFTEMGLPYVATTIIIFVIVPVFNYLGHRFWTFAPSPGSGN